VKRGNEKIRENEGEAEGSPSDERSHNFEGKDQGMGIAQGAALFAGLVR